MKSKALSWVIVLMLAACASRTPVQFAGVKVAEEAQVASCQYLDTVQGTSGWYGLLAQRGVDNARKEALRQAHEIAATHVVWIPASQGHGSTQVLGKAYRCGLDGSTP